MNRYDALKHAVKAHAGSTDKCGQPYILHPIAVAEQLEYTEQVNQEDAVVVALLHDVWEDTDYALPLPGMGGAGWRDQGQALVRLTRAENETYASYIKRLSGNQLASIVKLADLWHNLSPERQACLPEKERKSLEERYLKARDRIWEALGFEWWPEGEGER